MSPKFAISTVHRSTDYWSQTRQPLSCLVFLLPLLVLYEAGVLWLRSESRATIRNGADYWMRSWLYQAGFDYVFLLPILVVAILLVWHMWGQYPWNISSDTLVGMFAESLLFAFGLVVLGQLQDLIFQQVQISVFSMASHAHGEPAVVIAGRLAVARIISFVGAGVYEEFMFRLCLLPVGYAAFRILLLPEKWAALLAVLSTSLLFSLAHYIGSSADQFSLFSFTFRAFAGLFFAGLFLIRGFGITVGCHAFYDVLVGALLATGR